MPLTGQAQVLRTHLDTLKRLRGRSAGEGPPPRLAELKRFQAERLARTYADVAAVPRYRAATAFFLDDLYGPKDFSSRDEGMMRILPAMQRLLPASAVETAALAIEVEACSEDLDQRLARELGTSRLDEGAYGVAYRASAAPSEREHQIDLIVEVGKRLDVLVEKPLVFRTLKLMRAPAQVAGLGDLQAFLERGFEAFRAMGGAGEFLGTISTRERRIASRLFSSQPAPFSI